MIIDIHSHIIVGLDDGAPNIDVAIDMLRIAEKDDITKIIATPHYIHGIWKNNAFLVYRKLKELKKRIEQENINIQLFPGNEVFISLEVPELIKEGMVCTLNNSSYVLLELPIINIPEYTKDVIFQLKVNGYTPIIAHPERNCEIAENPNLLWDFIDRGALSQINATSLTGVYGSRTKEAAFTLLRHGMVHFVASDAHNCKGRAFYLSKSRKIVEAEIGKDITNLVFEVNGHRVLCDMVITPVKHERVQKSRKNFIFNLLGR